VNTRRLFGRLGTSLLSIGFLLGSTHAAWAKPSPTDLKVNSYVDILNSWSEYVYKTRNSYTESIASMKTGPTCKERNTIYMGQVGDSAPDDYKQFRKAIAKTPKLDADAAALAMVTALEEMMKTIKDADAYYASKPKDDCKHGQELHPVLLQEWDKYIDGERVVRAFVEKHNDDREAKDLTAAQKKYGKGFHYYHLKMLIDSKLLLRAVDAASAAKPDTAKLKDLRTTFQQSLTETQDLVKKGKADKKISDALYEGGYEQMVGYAADYAKNVDAFIKLIDAEATKTAQSDRKRARKEAIDMYNAFVEQSNKMAYGTSMK
jgi:hypothetical protein